MFGLIYRRQDVSIRHVFFWCFCVIIEGVILGFEMHTPLGFCTPLKGKRLDCMIKLIATDMDGTFLNSQGAYEKERLAKLLEAFKEKGMIFTVSSGRSLLAIEKLFEDFLEDIAIIAENGSIVQYQNKIIFADYMTREQYLHIKDKVFENPYHPGKNLLLSGKNGSYVLKSSSQDYIDKSNFYYENVQLVSDFEAINDDIFKLTTNFTGDTVAQGEEWLNQNVDYARAVTTGFDSIDIVLSEVNKAFGLSHLCDSLGIKKEDVIAFGDNLNDYEMMHFAGHSVAMENARDAIKEVANEVIGHCDDSSVLTYMEGLVK